jgi:hypothetical protein
MHMILVKIAATIVKHFIRQCGPAILQFNTLADMLDLPATYNFPSKIPGHAPLKHLHHHPEQSSCQRGVPSALRGGIPDEGVLRLNLVELLRRCQIVEDKREKANNSSTGQRL